MPSLFNQQISATYKGLLKTTSNGILSSSLAQITDGNGNGSQLYLSDSKINFYNEYEFPTSDGSANQVLKTDGSGVLTWEDDISGTVTSVALSVPTGLTVTGSPITTNGTITIGGTLGVANGGTGATTLTGILLGNGTSAISSVTDGTVGQVLSTNANGTYSFIDAGTGDVTVDGASVGNRVAVWNNTTGELRATSAIATENSNIYLVQPSTNGTDKFNYIIGGAFAINENDFGTQNTGFGHAVLNGADLTGGSNSSFGIQSQTALTTGSHNTSIGSFAMYDNRSGDYNVGLGAKTMFNQRISNNNVSIGYDSMDGVTASQTAASNNNVAIGYESLHIIEGGDNNTVLGYQSGSAITTGSNNVIIGSNTGGTIATSSNNIIISDGGGNNRIQVDSGGNVGIGTTPSDWKSTWKALNIGQSVGLFSQDNNTTGLSSNVIFDGTNWKNKNIGATAFYQQSEGAHYFYGNGSSTDAAGTTFSPTTRLTISSGGDVLINATSRANGYDTNFKTLSIASTVSDKASIIELIGTRGAGGNQNGMIHFLNNSAAMTETSRISGLTASGTNGHLGGAIGFDTKEHNGSLRRVAQFTDSGNLLFALSGKGIVFNQSASSGTSTSETLDAYEEGTWTPTLLNANGNESTEGMYTRIGNTVRVGGLIIFGSQSNTTQFTIQSFPFQVGSTNEGTRGGVSVGYSTSSTYYTILMDNGYTQARVWGQGATGNPTLASLSGTRVYFGGTYQV